MTSYDINLKPLHKTFKVTPKTKYIKQALELQKQALKMQEVAGTAENNPLKLVDMQTAFLDASTAFLKSALQLDDKQAQALEDVDFEAFNEMVNHVAMRIQGMSEAEVEKTLSESDPKKD